MYGRVALALVVLFAAVDASQRQQLEQFEGQVGCRFSTLVCKENEDCVDDGLFGNCQRTGMPKDTHRFQLNKEQLLELEQMLQFLIDSGYTWHSRFTQCVLISSLIAYRYHVQLNLELCRPFGKISEKWILTPRAFPQREDFFPPPTEVGGRETFPKTGDYDRFLEADSVHRMKAYGNQKRWIPQESDGYWKNPGVADPDVENFDEFFRNLSPDELQNLKQFLIEEENKSFGSGRAVKKSPVVVTKVKVTFDPGNDSESDSSKDGDTESIPKKPITGSSDKGTATAEQMVSSDSASQKILELADKGQGKELPQMKFSGHQRTGLSPQNPQPSNQLMTIAASGSQLGLTTVIPGGAQGKDVSHLRYEPMETPKMSTGGRTRQYLITMYFLCGIVGVIIAAALVIYVMRRNAHLKDKISKWAGSKGMDNATSEYQDLCRQHMQAKLTEKVEKVEPVHKSSRVEAISSAEQAGRSTSTGSSTSSWTEEPVSSNMDISTGHIILSYMEDHLTNKDRLQREWDSLCAYDAEPCSIVAAIDPTNMRKNRYTDILPYEHSRVKLNSACNVSGSDYINACAITDHDPRSPAYIAAQGPLPHTVADFWQMVWEQGSVVIVNLARLTENTISVCHRYWPEEGSDLYHIYEVHLISEHAWCDDYVVRSFFLKNLQTNETRTISQFHFLTWPNLGVPSSTKTLLDFRRKVNKSYRGRSCPIVVHCSDGAGRTGTYCLVDMALNRLHKGAKEIDIAATLEHIRDQRANMVRTKEQFEFVLAAVAEEVHAIVHVPPTQ